MFNIVDTFVSSPIKGESSKISQGLQLKTPVGVHKTWHSLTNWYELQK